MLYTLNLFPSAQEQIAIDPNRRESNKGTLSSHHVRLRSLISFGDGGT